MATLTMTPPTRQPFASLDTPRMRSIMRSKLNRQNMQNGAILSQKSSNSIFINEDSENIDPYTRSLSAKRKRTFDDDEISKGSPKPLKTSRIALSTRTPSTLLSTTSRLSTPLQKPPATPKSAPAPALKPAGRTPPSKFLKPSGGRRSTIGKTRPESASANAKRSVARPFSLATALAQYTTPKPKQPAGWSFDIHVDTEEEEMTNLMQHSTGVLDISDDEGKVSKNDGRGKENVPPVELGIDLPRSAQAVSVSVATAAARKEEKMEEDRAPLGELTASDYYPEDCNAFSYAVVYDDENVEAKKISPPSRSFVPDITTSIASLLETAIPPAEKSDVDAKTLAEVGENSSTSENSESS
ncbi:hypothetical protein N7478_007548 [Penicillium angulare]|uniref:uncharacterized protein n=1 Tax=Penicillium angulare TaxID=116970 RepID=UPI0025417B5D|nr:uncharacterized protein N7478_007548 [Penicillium angulare]KAJ5272423.1 hypothetical protein N7478_007548 [Penicillium angulare]